MFKIKALFWVALVLVGYEGAMASTASGQPNLWIDYAHNKIHRGQTFQYSSFTTASADAASISYVMYNPTRQLHLTISSSSVGAASLGIYEGVTSSGGSAVTLFGYNRGTALVSAYTTTSTLSVNPACSAASGTELIMVRVSTGTSPTTRVAGQYRGNEEWILRPGKRYLIRLTNQSGTTSSMELSVSFYED
jgi:hypothetical protein